MAEELPKQDLAGIAFSGACLFANKCLVTAMSGGIRIAFCEQAPQEGAPLQFRMAVMLPLPEALGLQKLLEQKLVGFEEAMQQMIVEARAEAEATAGKPDAKI